MTYQDGAQAEAASGMARPDDDSTLDLPDEMEDEYRAIFESTIDGLVIMDMDGTIVEVNSAACEMFGYRREELVGVSAAVLIPPEVLPNLVHALQCAAEGRPIPSDPSTRTLRKDGRVIDSETRTRVFRYRGQPHVLAVVRDIGERILAEQRLREQEEQYRGVFQATGDALIIGDPAGTVVEVNPSACRLYGYDHDEFVGLHISDLVHPDYRDAGPEQSRTIEAGGTVHVEELALRKDGTSFCAEVRGGRFVYGGQPMKLAVVRDITDRVQARELLEQRVEERTRELSTLLDVSYNVSSTLELQPLMDRILDQISGMVEYAGATISLIDGEESQVVAVRGRGSAESALGQRIPVRHLDPAWESWRTGPFIIDDVEGDSPDAVSYRQWRDAVLDSSFSYIRSWLVAPFIVNERLVGVLTLHGDKPGIYTPHHADLIFGIANQAAIAIENARLYERAQEVAVLEERQRLSRELHDSVSQALYGIGLGAQTARALAETDPTRVIQPLEYVLSLAQAAMAEMRGLIFELRPEAVEQEGLVAVLRRQAEAVSARHKVSVQLTAGGEPDTALDVKEALYRIAQEAMNNAVKHAGATEIALSIEQSEQVVVLAVRDNGKGFDTSSSFPGHLGLHSMRERAERLGGTMEMESAPGSGTAISVRISLAPVE